MSSTPFTTGSGRATGTLGCFESNSYRGTSSVDATTACNECNDDVNDYLRSVISRMLSIYDYRDKNGYFRKCISLARYVPTSCSDNDNNIISDNGATSTMMKHRRDFEDIYKACNGAFVLMGDTSRVAVAGYDTCYMKVNGNVTRVLNSLHVPDLDSNFFSHKI